MSTQVQSTTVTSATKAIVSNAVAIVDAIFHTGSILANVQQMSKMLREARRVEGDSPARAAALRSEARKIVLA